MDNLEEFKEWLEYKENYARKAYKEGDTSQNTYDKQMERLAAALNLIHEFEG